MIKILKIAFIPLLILLLLGCSEKSESTQENNDKQITYEDIAKNKNVALPKIELDIDNIIEKLQNNPANKKICSEYINKKSDFLFHYGEERYLSKEQLPLVEKRAYFISKKLFSMRLLLQEKLTQLNSTQDVDEACFSSFRKAFRSSRFIEEFVTEIGVASYKNRGKADAHDFSTNAYQFYLNPKYNKFELQSGDILLMRSGSFVGATIARIGDENGQFSHAALIYVDKNNTTMVVESLIEKGLVTTPYEEWRLLDNDVRILQFRMNDQEKAKKLAEKFYKKTLHTHNNEKIMYDFQMSAKSKNKLFCTEVIEHTFENANIPTHKTSFKNFKNHNFLENLTITSEYVFAPSDVEIEPKFELISEWRNYDKTNKVRILDAIMSSVMKWMSKENYKLEKTFTSSVGTYLAYNIRHVLGFLEEDLPLNMPYTFLETVLQLTTVSNLLEAHLTKLNTTHIKTHGYPMTYREMIIELEKYKSDDYRKYKSKNEESTLHELFAPQLDKKK